MKKYTVLIALLFAIKLVAYCQENLVFKGTVKCYIADDPRSTKGAKNVIVVPGFVPIKSGVTGTQGYYEINTGIPADKLDGKYVMVYFISSCKTCESKQNVFVSEDQMRPDTKKNVSNLTLETMLMAAGCKNTELKPLQSDSIYNSFIKLPSQNLDNIAALNVVTATPSFLNLLTTLSTLTAVSGGSSNADANNILPGKISYGQFLLASPISLSTNTGFNFAPSRDISEALFWNPSALANNYHLGGVYVSSNFKNNHKLSGFAKINERFTIGLGGIYTKQDESRPTNYQGLNGIPATPLRSLKEYATYLSPIYQINKKLSVAVTGKSVWQTFDRPVRITVSGSQQMPVNSFIDSTVNLQKFDADVSFSYKVSPSFQLGLNAMNLAGTELYADAVPVQKKVVPVQQLRSFGLGACYKMKQFNFGADFLFTQNDLYDVSLGVNYIPFNNALISGGFAFKQKSFSLAYRMKYFKLGYVNDNSFLINDKRKGKSSIFNGYIYSGLSFEF